ncbi:hypothetical protein [uncultured Kordia sp.]|uniref:hypothetical protein n=1 Tax=uncultured Kordia sp. TaxID=507699 RepID=UPI00261E55C0|nr:hypothetical protein [uncultured Kordia sp.]
MKNNRRITLDPDFLSKHKLSTAPPPPDSLFWELWENSKSIAEEALNTAFIQGIHTGTLDPTTYGGFNVSDAYYCFHGAKDYAIAASKAADHPVLQAFLEKKQHSYESYNATFPKIWHVKDADGIVPTQTCKEYSAYESSVTNEQDPIYTLIVMLPCEYLWAWLGQQLSPPKAGNLYASWITGNDDPSGAYAMGNFINAYEKIYPIKRALANEIYKQAMTFEYLNFETA